MALGLALELSKPEFSTLLQSTGYSLSRSLKQDVIVEYFILNRIYDIDLIDDALYSFGEKTICRA